jgi:mannose-6-phosphate isomerase-like protein (cupin superfamily)
MAAKFTHVNLGDVDDAAPGNGFGEVWEARVARTALAAEQTGITLFRLKPGRRSAFAHRHEQAEEVYVILRGDGRMKLDEHVVDVHALDAIRVSPAVSRAFEAGEGGLEFLVAGPHRANDGEIVADPWIA